MYLFSHPVPFPKATGQAEPAEITGILRTPNSLPIPTKKGDLHLDNICKAPFVVSLLIDIF